MQSATPGKNQDQDALLQACASSMLRCCFTSSALSCVYACVSCREMAQMTVLKRYSMRCATVNAHTICCATAMFAGGSGPQYNDP